MIEFLKNIFRRKVNKVKETQDANDHLQAYAMMSDWKRGFSEQKYENFIGDISFNERDVWPRAKKDNFKEYADLIKRKITEFSKIAKTQYRTAFYLKWESEKKFCLYEKASKFVPIQISSKSSKL